MKRLKLRGRIIERYGTIGAFCAELGISRATASNVLNGRTTPTWSGIVRWCYALCISPEEAGVFFNTEP